MRTRNVAEFCKKFNLLALKLQFQIAYIVINSVLKIQIVLISNMVNQLHILVNVFYLILTVPLRLYQLNMMFTQYQWTKKLTRLMDVHIRACIMVYLIILQLAKHIVLKVIALLIFIAIGWTLVVIPVLQVTF